MYAFFASASPPPYRPKKRSLSFFPRFISALFLSHLPAELLGAPLLGVEGAAPAHGCSVGQSRALRDPEPQGLHVPVRLQEAVDGKPFSVHVHNFVFNGVKKWGAVGGGGEEIQDDFSPFRLWRDARVSRQDDC